jgi:tetratricopeptide (TPR) repeat protein
MITLLGTHYYRLALFRAVQRDLSGAVVYARYACLLDPSRGDAARLLELCLYELGEQFPAEEGLERVRVLAEQKKWLAAAKAAGAIPHQSAAVLNIRGCLLAAAGRYNKAADCFARALLKDRGSRLAAAGFAETAPRRKRFWGRP